ncbi:MAG: glycosyltransferase family 2 protein [Paracoccaceae bacterium]|nr:MAG: glycosyltransferase family 2 protein [Paracoccaceae bacterium]
MASKTFLHTKYATDNADVAKHYGADDELLLRSHYETYGRNELRGIDAAEHMRVEGVLCSESGHVFLSGWADRRHIRKFHVTIDVGYERYDFGEIEPAWYRRPDVAAVIGDTERPSGYLALLELDDVTPHPNLTILVNGKPVHRVGNTRWQSVSQFLNQTLGAVAAVADLPIGQSMAASEVLHEPFASVWQAFLAKLGFVLAFQNAQHAAAERSIVITLYRRADMLIPQLESLAPLLAGSGTEIVVVCNELVGAEVVVERLRGFCQLWDLPLRLYLCSGNSGFSHANNFGAEVARGQTLVFMNPDVFPPEDPAHDQGVRDFLFNPPGQALHGAMLYYGDGALMHAGMYAVCDTVVDAVRATAARAARVEHFGKGLSHRVDDDAAALDGALRKLRDDVLLVSAALWKIDRELFLTVGGLSTEYVFAYYEDADFCLRLRERGIPIILDRASRWIHMEGAGKAFSPPQRSFMWLNRCLFSRRFGASPLVVDSHDDLELL